MSMHSQNIQTVVGEQNLFGLTRVTQRWGNGKPKQDASGAPRKDMQDQSSKTVTWKQVVKEPESSEPT